jgi:membrane-bound serine protease (ClpP class)
MTLIVTLLLVGAALMFLEVFLPGLIAGILGLLCLLTAVVLAYGESFATGNIVLGIVIAGLTLGTWCWLHFFPESRIAGLFISKQAIGELGTDRPELVGQTGVAATALRPSGTATLEGKRVDVVAESGFIERGTPVKVIAVEGLRVVVRAV